MNKQRKKYESDLSDEQWELIKDLIPKVKSNKKKGGRPVVYERREIMDAILYVLSSGCRWIDLPHDLPGKSIVWKYFDTWSKKNVFKKINKVLTIKHRLDLKKTLPQVSVSLIHKP